MMTNYKMRPKIEDSRFVKQKCDVCGHEFVLVYWYKEKAMYRFGEICQCHKTFHPVEGPTFRDWYEMQTRLRDAMKSAV